MLYETRFLWALGMTTVVEVPLVYGLVRYGFKFKKVWSGRLLFVAFLASFVTLPYFWFVLSPYVDARYYILIGEFLVFAFEALLYWQLLGLRLDKAAAVSLVANAVSYGAGVWLVRLF